MNRPQRLLAWPAVWIVLGVVAAPVLAEQPPPAAGPAPSYRQLAPGVLQSVDPQRQLEESFSRHDVVELLAEDPTFDWAKDESFRHDVWTLEFRFKPVRMIWVDVPKADGFMERKLLWYMVYSVTNRSVKDDTTQPPQYGCMHPVLQKDGTYKVEYIDRPVRFIPEFVLESPKYNKAYQDRVVPVAVGPIRLREDRNRRFYTTVEMAGREIAPGETLWGVVTWEGIDPRTDRFSIYVKGLTNAYRWADDGSYKAGAPIGTGRRLARKTLQLNFWRPGDEYLENEREIRYGAPGDVDYKWVYR